MNATYNLIIKKDCELLTQCDGCVFKYKGECTCNIDEMLNVCYSTDGIWKFGGILD